LEKHLQTVKYLSEIFEDDEYCKRLERNKINFARNMAKHLNPSKVPAWFVNPKEEAEYMIYRAICNYRDLDRKLSGQMEHFLENMN